MKKIGKCKVKKKYLAMFTLLSMLFEVFPQQLVYSQTSQSLDTYMDDLSSYTEVKRYADYLPEEVASPSEEVAIEAENYVRSDGMEVKVLTDYEGQAGNSIFTEEEGLVEWEVNIEEEGYYNLDVLYYPIEGKSSDIQRGIFIDGQLPFQEASIISFNRFWDNERDEIEVDNQGNDLKPSQVEAPEWSEMLVRDSSGYYNKPFEFYFSKGEHTITFVSQREPMVIRKITLKPREEVMSYEEKMAEYTAKGYEKASGETITIEAEKASLKSSPMLYPVTDHSSPAITPYSPSEIKMNTIGGEKWNTSGQWIEWTINVPATGLYELGLNLKQNFIRGIPVTRKLTIDGKVPFKEAEQLTYKYDSNWRTEFIGDGENPYLFYLEEGQHTLRLEATLGDLAPLIREVELGVKNLNELYRKVIMVTGVEPDKYRDYQLTSVLPDVIEGFGEERDRLNEVAKNLQELVGGSSDKDAILLTVAKQTDMFNKDIEKIISRLADFKLNIGTLGTWLIDMQKAPLQIDALYVVAPGGELPKTNNSLASRMWHNVQKLYYSFIIDYNAIGNVSEDKEARTITVWVPTGRDQANTIKALIDESFTPETGINVNLMLVQPDVLLRATLSGEGPDVAMQVTNDVPLNFAMRVVAIDLKQFPDYDQVAERFYDSAKVPYSFDGAAYALPETETFFMLFYRKDILKELDLEVPKTWDEVKTCLSVLSKNNMEVGLPVINVLNADMVYGNFLYQQDGQFYTDDAKASALDSDTGVNTFKEWVKYYTDYTLTREYDFVSRFRTGEVPIGIADYQTYNTLQVSAPEIDGLWGFTTMPGTVMEDGSVNTSSTAGGTGMIILEQSKDKEAAWEYLKWWTSEEIQVQYGREMEGLMGAAARYPTANKAALSKLPWPIQDYKNLEAQLETVKGIPQVPGGYYTARNVNNAFYKVVVDKEVGAREALMDAVRYIDDEITNKRKEFGLDE